MIALAYSLGLFLLWTLVGRAMVALFAPRFGVLRSWLVAPGLGLAAFLLGLMAFNQAGVPIRALAWPMTLAFAGAALAVLFWRRPLLPGRALAPFAAAVVFSLFWAGWPALESGFNWISYGNDDMANYCLAAERFADHGFYAIPTMAELSGRDYASYYYFMHVADMMRFGAEHIVAWSASLARLKATQAFMPVILALSLAQLCSAAALVLQHGRHRRLALVTACVLAVSPLFLLGTLYQLIAQVAGVGLLLTTLTLLTRAWGRVQRRAIIAYAVLPAATSAALCITYPETTPFTGAAYAAYAVVALLRRRLAPGVCIALTAYALLGCILLLRYNLISFVSVLVMQATSALHAANLLLSLFPYFLLPTGFSNLFGWMPIARDFSPLVVNVSILAGFALAAVILWRAARSAWQLNAAAILLLVQVGAAFMLYRGANDFGLYKLAMWMQPALAAALASLFLAVARRRLALAFVVVGVFAVTTTPTALHYTRSSKGTAAGGLTELRFASVTGLQVAAPADRDAQITGTIENVVAAKFAASELRGRQLALVSRDYFFPNTRINFLDPPLPVLFHPHFDDMAAARPLMLKRNAELVTTSSLWFTEFSQPVLARPTDHYLRLTDQLSLFNKFGRDPRAPIKNVFVLEPAAAARNQLIFVHSGRGNHYYLGDRRKISFFQQEPDLFSPGRDFNGLGRFMLLRVEHPTEEFYLRIAATRTPLANRSTWSPKALVHSGDAPPRGRPIGIVGNGAFNLFVGPLKPQMFEGAAYVAIDFQEIANSVPDVRPGLKALYNTDVALDYRRIIGWARDVSAISSDDYARLNRPARVARFPEDLANAEALEFSGLYEDGWMSPESRVVLAGASARGVVHIRGAVPAIEGSTLGKGTLKLTVEGRETIMNVGHGDFDWLVPLPHATDATHVGLKFNATARLPGDDDRAVGAKLQLFEVLPALPTRTFDYGTVGSPRLAAQGIDQDGWMAPHATVALPALDAPTQVIVRVEFPGWANVTQTTVRLRLGDEARVAHEQTLAPGQTTLRLRVPASATPPTLQIEAGDIFTLPAPDGRQRALRVIGLELAPDSVAAAPAARRRDA